LDICSIRRLFRVAKTLYKLSLDDYLWKHLNLRDRKENMKIHPKKPYRENYMKYVPLYTRVLLKCKTVLQGLSDYYIKDPFYIVQCDYADIVMNMCIRVDSTG